jgi:hypothetical protein
VRGEVREGYLAEWDASCLMMISHPDDKGRLWRIRWSVERVKGQMRVLQAPPQDLTALQDPLKDCCFRNRELRGGQDW